MYLDKDAILKALTKEDIISICDKLGSPEYREDSKGNLCFSTAICHGGDSPYKLIYYLPDDQSKYGKFHCFTCGDTYDIVELVIRASRLKGQTLTWYRALQWIGQMTGKLKAATPIEDDNNLVNDSVWLNRLKNLKKGRRGIPTLNDISENILNIFYYAPYEGWLNEHMTSEALSRFEIGYYGLTNQLTIPHRDINGRLIGIRGRFLDDRDVENFGKYVPLYIEGRFLNHQLGNNLYGLNVTADKIKQCKKIMLVEGEKSCIQAYSYFEDNSFVAAVCGSHITKTQIRIILKELQVEEVLVGFDREYHQADSFEASIYWNKLVKTVASLVPFCKVYLVVDKEDRLPYKASPTDMGKDVLLQLMKEKTLITQEEVNHVLSEERKNREKK